MDKVKACPTCIGTGFHFPMEFYLCCDDHGKRLRGCDECGGTGWRTNPKETHV